MTARYIFLFALTQSPFLGACYDPASLNRAQPETSSTTIIAFAETPTPDSITEAPEEDCVVATKGCACTMGEFCEDPLVCEGGRCTCSVGSFGCACTNGGSCDQDFICLEGVCSETNFDATAVVTTDGQATVETMTSTTELPDATATEEPLAEPLVTQVTASSSEPSVESSVESSAPTFDDSNESDIGEKSDDETLDPCAALPVDSDGDGFGPAGHELPEGCPVDCDDEDSGVHPEAKRKCNGRDNDCDGVEDADACESLESGCRYKAILDGYYMFCKQEKTWDQAEAYCEGLGPDWYLVTIDDSHEEDTVVDEASYGRTWIGYRQTSDGDEPDGGWEWASGASSNYTHWKSGEPNDGSNAEDCTYIHDDTTWFDSACANEQSFVCENHDN